MCLAPWAAQGSVSVTMVSRLCSVTIVTLVTWCGVASAQCGGIGSLGAVFPLYQVTPP